MMHAAALTIHATYCASAFPKTRVSAVLVFEMGWLDLAVSVVCDEYNGCSGSGFVVGLNEQRAWFFSMYQMNSGRHS